MSQSFYFYDLETSSGSPKTGRIMQFAGQRTDENLQPIGEPDNILVSLTDDVVPEPDAILVHGITPQNANSEGISEVELANYFNSTIAQPGTIFVGYNNIRFDDEFMRYMCYRTFYEPYEWHWKDGRSRWDLLDAMRMMRALRPEGIQWPYIDGKPTVKLELLAKENGLIHENAHDALSDVEALIQLARLFKESQPKLFAYLLQARDKKFVAKTVESGEPFLYTSGKYSSDFQKTTVVLPLFKHPRREGMIVYDLRHDPKEWLSMTAEELAKHWKVPFGDDTVPLPVKTLQYNRCPAIAPLSVLDSASSERIGYDEKVVAFNHKTLTDNVEFKEHLMQALDILDNAQQTALIEEVPIDNQLYDGFWNDNERSQLSVIRHTAANDLTSLLSKISNKRMRELLPIYKARYFKGSLTEEEYQAWESYRSQKLLAGKNGGVVSRCFTRMNEIAKQRTLDDHQKYLLEELQLYVESILPEPQD